MSTHECEPINVDELLNRCLGQIDFAQEILHDFMGTCQRGIENLQALDELPAGDEQIERLRAEAHRLKGTSATVSANHLAELFQLMESNIRAGDAKAACDQFHSVKDEFDNIRRFVKTNFVAPATR